MNTMTALVGSYLTQVATDIPIEQRIFVTKITGIKATDEYYRVATDEEIEAWEDYKKRLEEQIV